MEADELMAALEEKGRVIWPVPREWVDGYRFYLILEKTAQGPVGGSLTFSELRHGFDQQLRKQILAWKTDWKRYAGKILLLSEPWVIRIRYSGKAENTSWDWVWTGGETVDLVGKRDSQMGECRLVGIGIKEKKRAPYKA